MFIPRTLQSSPRNYHVENPSAPWTSNGTTTHQRGYRPYSSRHIEHEVQLATTAVAKIRGNSTVSFGTASCRSNLEWYSTCPNFMSNVDPGKWWSFVEAWIVSFEKGSFAWKEAVIAQSHNLDVQSFSNSLLWARSWEFFVLSGLDNPCFGNLENNVSNSCTNATYQNKPILFGVPARDVRNELHLCPTKTPNAISCGLGNRLHPGVRISSCWHITFLTTKSFKKLFDTCEAFFMSVSHDLFKKSANFQLSTPISHRILGVNNTSAVRTIWVTAYTTSLKTQATFGCETTHLKPPLVCCSLKHGIHWVCCERQQKLKPHRRVIEPPNPEKRSVMGWKRWSNFWYLAMLL